ncbi:MAG: hypothetical protein JXA14_26090 [Anaerolineae bacterium]|nr:hypothetical protein [Anaerolineae bacterium]
MKSREAVRDYLAGLLDDKLVDDLKIVVEVLNHGVGDPQGRGPLVAVLSAGSNRPRATGKGNKSLFRFNVQIWTPYGDGRSRADAEDRADAIEQGVADVIAANCKSDHWYHIAYADYSTELDIQMDSGHEYLFESIPIEVGFFG